MSYSRQSLDIQLLHTRTGKPLEWISAEDERYFNKVMSNIIERIANDEQQKKASAATETQEKTTKQI